jgi:hypothetical protein
MAADSGALSNYLAGVVRTGNYRPRGPFRRKMSACTDVDRTAPLPRRDEFRMLSGQVERLPGSA